QPFEFGDNTAEPGNRGGQSSATVTQGGRARLPAEHSGTGAGRVPTSQSSSPAEQPGPGTSRLAKSQICLPICEALLCPASTLLMTSAGTPHAALCSSKPLSILLSAVRKILKSLHNSSGGAFFWPAACSA